MIRFTIVPTFKNKQIAGKRITYSELFLTYTVLLQLEISDSLSSETKTPIKVSVFTQVAGSGHSPPCGDSNITARCVPLTSIKKTPFRVSHHSR